MDLLVLEHAQKVELVGAVITLIVAIGALLKARRKSTEATALNIEADAKIKAATALEITARSQRENTAQHAIVSAREEVSAQLREFMAERREERAKYQRDADQQAQDIRALRERCDGYEKDNRKVGWKLDEALAELETTRRLVGELQAQNKEQASQIDTLKRRVRELESDLEKSDGLKDSLVSEMQEMRRAFEGHPENTLPAPATPVLDSLTKPTTQKLYAPVVVAEPAPDDSSKTLQKQKPVRKT